VVDEKERLSIADGNGQSLFCVFRDALFLAEYNG
jgi:hypothetical protein